MQLPLAGTLCSQRRWPRSPLASRHIEGKVGERLADFGQGQPVLQAVADVELELLGVAIGSKPADGSPTYMAGGST
jgi:hypothetical protein